MVLVTKTILKYLSTKTNLDGTSRYQYHRFPVGVTRFLVSIQSIAFRERQRRKFSLMVPRQGLRDWG